MAKRFTETGIWQDEWFMELSPDYKLAYMFIKDNCDQAGVWKPNKRLAEMMIGMPIDWEDFLNSSGDRIKLIQGGYWWITKFCEFQYGKLSEKCKPHEKVFQLLNKYNLLDRVSHRVPDRVQSTLEEKEEDKEKEEVKEEEKEKEPKIEIILPFNTDSFRGQWDLWKNYKQDQFKFKFKSPTTEQAALKGLADLSGNNEQMAIKIIHQSIGNGWKGFFEIKNNGKSNTNQDKRSKFTNYFASKTG